MSSSFVDPCARDDGEEYDLYLHIGAVFILIGVSFLGTIIPIVGKWDKRLRIGEFTFVLGKNFGTGVILATGLIHMYTPAQEALTNECLPSLFKQEYRSFAGVFALFACFTIQAVQTLAVQHSKAAAAISGHRHSHHHHHGNGGDAEDEEGHVHTLLLERDTANRRVTTYMLELGIVTHSIIIGVALGVARGGEFNGLLVALSFHQFFEGVALSTTVLDSGFTSALQPILVVVFYSLTTPSGIALGIGISNVYNENSPTALIVQGIFDAVSAGILLYDGLVNMATQNITRSHEFAKRGPWAKASIFIALWLGATVMAIIGRWA